MTTFSQLMRIQRMERKLTFAQLSAEVGYHPSYLSLVERGLRQLDEEGVVRVAHALGIDPSTALLSALRERLPDELRALVPSDSRGTDQETIHRAARQLQAEHFDFEIESLELNASVDWDGNVRIVRVVEGCRPNSTGRPVWEILFRERTVGVDPNPEAAFPKFAVRQAPADLEYEVDSTTTDSWRQNRLFFPRGWRRSPHPIADSFSFVFETYQEQALLLDASSIAKRIVSETLRQPIRGSLNYHVPFFVRRLTVSIEFPRGYQPERWETWAWWGTGNLESVPRNLIDHGPSRSYQSQTEDGRARLVVQEPLAGYSFAVVWTPADRQRYLEARYGGAH